MLEVHVISDSLGETGAVVVRAVMSQFRQVKYEIKRFPYINKKSKLDLVLERTRKTEDAMIIYTLVDNGLGQVVEEFSKETGILAVDLLTPLMSTLTERFGQEPSREPGIIRKLDRSYFSRVAAIEFAVRYDDGKDPRGLLEADLVLIGVSRTSKTPLSMYLANKNIKVANIPLVIEVPAPKELFEIPAMKIIGLTNSPEKLNAIRETRLKALGLKSGSSYANMERILDELDYAEGIMKRLGCPVIDVSNKAIEETSEIILDLLHKIGIDFN